MGVVQIILNGLLPVKRGTLIGLLAANLSK